MIEDVIKQLPRKPGRVATNLKPVWVIVHHDGVYAEDYIDPLERYIADANYSLTRPYCYGTQYHFMISRTGRILQGLPLDEMCYHCSNDVISLDSVSVCFQGNYQVQELSIKQRESFNYLLSYLKARNYEKLSWHRYVSGNATACPGNNIISFLENLNFNNFTEMSIDEAKKIVYFGYRLVFGREANEDEQNEWGNWILENTVSAFLSAIQASPEAKTQDESLIADINQGEVSEAEREFYIKQQPNGLRRTAKEIIKDKTSIF